MPLTSSLPQRPAGYYQDIPKWQYELWRLARLAGLQDYQMMGGMMPGMALPKSFGGIPFKEVLKRVKGLTFSRSTLSKKIGVESSFILPKGENVDVGFHSAVGNVFGRNIPNPVGTFMETGAIRVNSFPSGRTGAQRLMFDLARRPTPQQKKTILDLVTRYRTNEVLVEYAHGTSKYRVFDQSDVKSWQMRKWLDSLGKQR